MYFYKFSTRCVENRETLHWHGDKIDVLPYKLIPAAVYYLRQAAYCV